MSWKKQRLVEGQSLAAAVAELASPTEEVNANNALARTTTNLFTNSPVLSDFETFPKFV